MKIIKYLFCLGLILTSSCGYIQSKDNLKITNEMVIGKNVTYFDNREPVYRVAFSSGYDKRVSFGEYCKFKEVENLNTTETHNCC